MGYTVTVRLDRDLADWLARESNRTGESQGKIIRDQLARARSTAAAQAFMKHAGVVRLDPRLSTRKGFARS
jgi:hypothetical protein